MAVKYYFDKEKKEYFLRFWQIKDIGDFEKIDSLSFAFRFSQLFHHQRSNSKKKGEVFACIQRLIADCLENKILEIKKNRLLVLEEKAFSLSLSQNDEVIKMLDNLNITTSTLEHSQVSNHLRNKINWTKTFLDFLSRHRLWQKKEKNIQDTYPHAPKITFKQKNTAKLYKTLHTHQGIALFALDEKTYKTSVAELIKNDLAEIVILGQGALPGLLLKKGEEKTEKEPKKSSHAIEDQLLLASSYLKRRFIHHLLSVEQLFFESKMLVTPPACHFLSSHEKNQKIFLQQKVWNHWKKILKNQKKTFKNLCFEEKVKDFIAAGVSKNMPIFRELQLWFLAHYPQKNENESVFCVEKKELFAQINRRRFLQGKRPFRQSALKKTLKQLKYLGVVAAKNNRYIFLEEVFLTPPKEKSEEIADALSIDSDITMSAYVQDIPLKEIHFLSLFCQTTYTEHIIQFSPSPSLAAFAWYSGLNEKKIVQNLEKWGKSSFSPKIKQYFSVYFEHAKAAQSNKISSISFASRGFFMTAKHIIEKLLEEKPEHQEHFLALKEKKSFIFFDAATKKLFLDHLSEKNLIQQKAKKNHSSKKSCE